MDASGGIFESLETGTGVYGTVLIFVMAEGVLIALCACWLVFTALAASRALRLDDAFARKVAPGFLDALADEDALASWLREARRFPEAVQRRFLEPRIRATSGDLNVRIVDAYTRLGLRSKDVLQAESRSWRKRIRAMRRLVFVAGPQHAELLIRRSDDLHAVRVLAAIALGRVGTARQVFEVLRRLELPRRLMEQPVHAMLEAMDEERLVKLMDLWSVTPSATVRRILLEVAVRRVPWLCERYLPLAAGSFSTEVRIGAARSCGMLASASSRRVVLRLAIDEEPQVRAQAARSLGLRGDYGSAEALAGLAEDRDFWVRQNAAAALRALGDTGRRTLETLRDSSQDDFARDAARQELERHNLRVDVGEAAS